MKRIIYLGILMSFMAVSCSETSNPAPAPGDGGDDKKEETLSKLELLIQGEWFIEKAEHDGTHDASSTGKTVEFFEASSYNFNGSFDGTYEWSSDSSTLHLDEGSSFSQDWKIDELKEGSFKVSFNSPFTGKPSTWEMIIK